VGTGKRPQANQRKVWGTGRRPQANQGTVLGIIKGPQTNQGTVWGTGRRPQANQGTVWGTERKPQANQGTVWGIGRRPQAHQGTVWGTERKPQANQGTVWGTGRRPQAKQRTAWDCFRLSWVLAVTGAVVIDNSLTLWRFFNKISYRLCNVVPCLWTKTWKRKRSWPIWRYYSGVFWGTEENHESANISTTMAVAVSWCGLS
jgi:hypothetical protein